MQIALGSDHGGYRLKEEIKKYLGTTGYSYEDFGCISSGSCDYPDFGFKAAESVSSGECDKGILICKSGIGMSIVANKVKGIRAALCNTPSLAEKSRKHNDANILVLSAEYIDTNSAKQIVNIWFNTQFEGERHQSRLDKISDYENKRKG